MSLSRETDSRVCAAMGCYRMFRAADGKLYHSKACARRAAERRRELEYRRLVGRGRR